MIKLSIHPRKTLIKSEFVRVFGPYAVALDGYVPEAPWFDATGPNANFNHHEGVNRLATRSTAGQVFLALKMGLMDTFTVGGTPELTVHVNDCDQDVCLAVYLLRHHERVSGKRSEPLLNKLIFLSDMQDTCSGAFPVDLKSEAMRQLAWIYEPYTTARDEGTLLAMTAGQMEAVIEAVGARIEAYTLGRGQEKSTNTDYTVLNTGSNGWKQVTGEGPGARTAMLSDGVKAFVSYLGEMHGPMGVTYRYTIGKLSPFVPFPLPLLFGDLNNEEARLRGNRAHSGDQWGGGDSIGGSPRESGSVMNPLELFKFVDLWMEDNYVQEIRKDLSDTRSAS